MLQYNPNLIKQVQNTTNDEALAQLFNDNSSASQELIDSMMNTFDSDYTEETFINETNPNGFITNQQQVIAILIGQSTNLINHLQQYIDTNNLGTKPANLHRLYTDFTNQLVADVRDSIPNINPFLATSIANVIHQVVYANDLDTNEFNQLQTETGDLISYQTFLQLLTQFKTNYLNVFNY